MLGLDLLMNFLLFSTVMPFFGLSVKKALRRNLAERAIDGVFSDRGFSIDSAV
jgi:hypothetical protein